MPNNDELTPDEIKEIERIMAEPDVILTPEQIQMLAGTYETVSYHAGSHELLMRDEFGGLPSGRIYGYTEARTRPNPPQD